MGSLSPSFPFLHNPAIKAMGSLGSPGPLALPTPLGPPLLHSPPRSSHDPVVHFAGHVQLLSLPVLDSSRSRWL